MIIAAYAGCGKTAFAAKCRSSVDLHCIPYKYYLDEDSDRGEAGKANFENEMRPEWPRNYISAIKDVTERYEYILIPSDFRVLALLRGEKIPYTLVFPCRDAKEEYRRRYVARGNTEDFLSIFIGRWDWFLDNLEADSFGEKIVLGPHRFLADAIEMKE